MFYSISRKPTLRIAKFEGIAFMNTPLNVTVNSILLWNACPNAICLVNKFMSGKQITASGDKNHTSVQKDKALWEF